MVLFGVKAVLGRAINRPASQGITDEWSSHVKRQHAVVHHEVGLDRLGVGNAWVGYQLDMDQSCPLHI